MSGLKPRVRFAPSPTGDLHLGGVRSALFNYLFAKRNGGQFILRIEDTDQARSKPHFVQRYIEELKWLGLFWDEGPIDTHKSQGDYGPYFQNQRLHFYKKYAHILVEKGLAYPCFCTEEILKEKREHALKNKLSLHYDGHCRRFSSKEVEQKKQAGVPFVLRFYNQHKKERVVEDLVRGSVKFPKDMVGDFILMRANQMPVYNFCCAIDDASMKVTHVFRAEEHLSNTCRQLLIYEALGWSPPQFGHLSLILGKDGQKLSKRHVTDHNVLGINCAEYRNAGFLPEALLNYLALLGWSVSDNTEFFTLNDLKSHFSIERVNASPAIFDVEKLTHINVLHLRHLSTQKLWELLQPVFAELSMDFPPHCQEPSWQNKAFEALLPYMQTLKDVQFFAPFSTQPFSPSALGQEVLQREGTRYALQFYLTELEKRSHSQNQIDVLDAEGWQILQKSVQKKIGLRGKPLFELLRTVVLGHPQGVELKKAVPLLPVSELIHRANACLQLLNHDHRAGNGDPA